MYIWMYYIIYVDMYLCIYYLCKYVYIMYVDMYVCKHTFLHLFLLNTNMR